MNYWRFWVMLLIFGGGCGHDDKLSETVDKLGRATGPSGSVADSPSPRADIPETPSPEAPQEVLRGVVLETIDASRYTYINIQLDNGTSVWSAVPQIALSKGESVELIQSLVMTNFESKTLGRVFPTVVFGVLKRQAEALPAGHPPMPAANP